MKYVFMVLVMLFIVGLGIYMLVTGNYHLLHSYHYATTPEAERPQLAKETGVCLIVCGLSTGLLITNYSVLTILGLILFVASIGAMLACIVHHNGALFSFATTPPIQNKNHSTGFSFRTALVSIVLVIVFVALSAPAVYMMATGDPRLLHSYHYEHVSAQAMPAFTFWEGFCMLGLSIGGAITALGGIVLYANPHKRVGKILCGLGVLIFVASLAGMLLVIQYFNGSIMGSA